jgi:hypothetical protein
MPHTNILQTILGFDSVALAILAYAERAAARQSVSWRHIRSGPFQSRGGSVVPAGQNRRPREGQEQR